MPNEFLLLALTARSLGFIHTILGPDHYLPFIMMARAGKWSRRKTALVTCLSGVGHVLGSVLLGLIGIAAGLTLSRLEVIEAWRCGGVAADRFRIGLYDVGMASRLSPSAALPLARARRWHCAPASTHPWRKSICTSTKRQQRN